MFLLSSSYKSQNHNRSHYHHYQSISLSPFELLLLSSLLLLLLSFLSSLLALLLSLTSLFGIKGTNMKHAHLIIQGIYLTEEFGGK